MSAQAHENIGDLLSVAVARRLRGQLAERQISGSKLAKLTGLPQSTVSRKLLGGTPFTLDEIQLIADVTDISVSYVLLGTHENTPTGDGGGGPEGQSRPEGRGPKQRTSD